MTFHEEKSTAEAVMDFMDQFESVMANIAGYRQKMIDGGFSEASAEAMAVDFHRYMLALMLGVKS